MKMWPEFIDRVVRKNIWGLFRGALNEELCIGPSWGLDVRNVEENEISVKQYEVKENIFEIIVKAHALSLIKVPKDEIIRNLKKKYKEKDIIEAISFLKENNLLNEYLEIPHLQDAVTLEISPRKLRTGNRSKKFYDVYIWYAKEIGRIVCKRPRDKLTYTLKIGSEPLILDGFSSKWSYEYLVWCNIRLQQAEYRELQIFDNMFDRFMSKTCVVEFSRTLNFRRFDPECKKYRLLFPYCENSEPVSEIIAHKDYTRMKKLFVNRCLTKIKQIGGRNIVIKEDGPVKIDVKFTMPKEVVFSLGITERAGLRCSFPLFRFAKEQKREDGSSEVWWINLSDYTYWWTVRSKIKGEDKDYFFINDESESIDNIIMEEFDWAFPDSKRTEFINYLAEKYKRAGVANITIKENA